MTHKWKRNLIGGLSFTTMLFIFQACYGTPQDIGYDVLIEGKVLSKTSGQPIKGIKVTPISDMQYQFTDEAGKFSFYTLYQNVIELRFEDVDSTQNGTYLAKDTTLKNIADTVYLTIALDDK